MSQRKVFVGDLHGKYHVLEKILEKEHKSSIYLTGDYIDSYDCSLSDQKKTLLLVLSLIEADKVKGLMGNHELSYLYPAIHQASGFSSEMAKFVTIHREKMLKLLLPFIILNPQETRQKQPVFFSHAGLSLPILDSIRSRSPQNFLIHEMLSLWANRISNNSPLHYIGQARGGKEKTGGIFWCDFKREFESIPNLIQIFGHSRCKKYFKVVIDKKSECWNFNIDNLSGKYPSVLVLEDGIFEEIFVEDLN